MIPAIPVTLVILNHPSYCSLPNHLSPLRHIYLLCFAILFFIVLHIISVLSFRLVMYMRSIWTGCYAPETILTSLKKLLQCMRNNCQEGCNLKLTFWFCLLFVTLQGNNCQPSVHYTFECNKSKSHLKTKKSRGHSHVSAIKGLKKNGGGGLVVNEIREFTSLVSWSPRLHNNSHVKGFTSPN